MAFAQLPIMEDPESTPVSSQQLSIAPASEPYSAFFSKRSQRQLGLFAAGAGFFILSSFITRRSIVRRYKLTQPKFYHPSNRLNHDINGAMEAFEALNIATLNVASVGIMATGGLLWAFDISSLDDIKRKVRTNLGTDSIRDDRDTEAEIEEWFASVLARKEFKALRGEFKAEQEVKANEITKAAHAEDDEKE